VISLLIGAIESLEKFILGMHSLVVANFEANPIFPDFLGALTPMLMFSSTTADMTHI
jgi:hypothetical protein